MNNTEIKMDKKKDGVFYINWEPIKLLKIKEKKGEIKIDYFLRLFKEKKNR